MDLLIGFYPPIKGHGRTFLPEELMQLCDSASRWNPLEMANDLILDTIPEYTAHNYCPGVRFGCYLSYCFIAGYCYY